MKRSLIIVCLVGALLMAAAGDANAANTDGVPQFGNVFLIIGENTNYGQLNKNTAPYLLGTIQPESAWLTNYWATTHYSESNYVAMTSGQFTPCEQKDGPISSCHQDVPNLFNQLDVIHGAGAWTSWMESMPMPCYLDNFGSDAGQNNQSGIHIRHL